MFIFSNVICLHYVARCLKITEKVSFSTIASEASYGYILSKQKLIKNAKNGSPKTWSLQSYSVTRQVTFDSKKLMKNANFQMGHFEYFSNYVRSNSVTRYDKNWWKCQMRHFGWFSNTVCPLIPYIIDEYHQEGLSWYFLHYIHPLPQCLKITKNVALDFFEFWLLKWPVW